MSSKSLHINTQIGPKVSVVTQTIVENLLKEIRKLTSDRASISVASQLSKSVRDKLLQEIAAEKSSGTATATIAANYTSSAPTDTLSSQLYSITPTDIKDGLNNIDDQYKTSFFEDITLNHKANIAWYINPSVASGSTPQVSNKDFMLKDTNFKFQENVTGGELANAETRALSILSALMKSNSLNTTSGDVEGIAPFTVASHRNNRILPEHVGLAPHKGTVVSSDIILLNNAFSTPDTTRDTKYNTLKTASYDCNKTNSFEEITKDNSYYRNNSFVKTAAELNNYINRFDRPNIKDNEDAYNFGDEISTQIFKNEYLNTNEFKSEVCKALVNVRNIINGSVDGPEVIKNICAMVGSILASSHADTDYVQNIIKNSVTAAVTAATATGSTSVSGVNTVANPETVASKVVETFILDTNKKADSNTSVANALANIEESLENNTIPKAGAEFLRIIGVHNNDINTAGANKNSLEKIALLAVKYVVKIIIEAANAGAVEINTQTLTAITGAGATADEQKRIPLLASTQIAINIASAINYAIEHIDNELGSGGTNTHSTKDNTLHKITPTILNSCGVVNIEDDWYNSTNLADLSKASGIFNTAAGTAATALTKAGTEVVATVNVTDASKKATTYVSALRIKNDPNVGFLKDVIRKIKLPIYNIDLNTGKITSLNDGSGSNVHANLQTYVTYLFNRVPIVKDMTPAQTPANGYSHTDFEDNKITAGASGTTSAYIALQTFLKQYAYHPLVKFDTYDHTNNKIEGISTPNDQIHQSIYNSSILVNIITSPNETTEAYIKMFNEINLLQQEGVKLDLKISALEAKIKPLENKVASYNAFSNELLTGFKSMYTDPIFKRYYNNASGKKVAPTSFVTVGGNKKIIGGNNENPNSNSKKLQFKEFINTIPERINGNNISQKQKQITNYEIEFSTKYSQNFNENSNLTQQFRSKILELINPIANTIATNLKNKNLSKINEKLKEVNKQVENIIKQNKKKMNIEELSSLLNKNISSIENKRIHKAAIRKLLTNLNKNLNNNTKRKGEKIISNLSTNNTNKTSTQQVVNQSVVNTSTQQPVVNPNVVNKPVVVNASVQQQPVVNQTIVNAAQTAVTQAIETVNTVTNATKQLKKENVPPPETLSTAQELVNNAINATNPTVAINESVNAIAKAKEALKELINSVKTNENTIPNESKSAVRNLLKKINTTITNETNITMNMVKKAYGNQNNNFGNSMQKMFTTNVKSTNGSTNVKSTNVKPTNNNYGLSFMSEGHQTNSTVTEKINHGKSLRNALNTYNSNQSDNKKSALRSAYNEFVGKTNVNKSSVVNKNNLISRANTILNPTQSSSNNVIPEETTSENNSINAKVVKLLANVNNTSSTNSSLQKLDKIKAFYNENKNELSDEQIVNLGMKYGNILKKITESNLQKKNKSQRNIQNYSQYMITLKGFKSRGNNTNIPNSVKGELLDLIRDIERNIKQLTK